MGDFDGGAAQVDISLSGLTAVTRLTGAPATQITVLRTRNAIFAKLPTNPFSAGKPWVSLDAATLASLSGQVIGDVGVPTTGAPLDALAYLKGVSSDVQVIGPDTARPGARGGRSPERPPEQHPQAVTT